MTSPRPSTARRRAAGFTILEILVAMAVMSLLLVLLLNMVDSATKLWRENENRVDSYREARAALGIIARDLENLVATTNTNWFLLNKSAIPKLSGVGPALTDTNNASAVFFLSALPAKAQPSGKNRSDVCQTGYFVAFARTTASTNQSLNLYRYFLGSDDTFAAISGSAPLFIPDPPSPTATNTELLARNITGFSIRAFSTNASSLDPFSPSPATPVPDLVEISISAINQDTAKKLASSAEAWTNTNAPVLRPAVHTFTTRIRLNRPPPASPTPAP